ncbi:MAG: hypothetical protein CVT47_02920 [Thermoplasmata archaeon HGW-Thermoplasmata-2]|nr:MAG: hypothetical protein CVT47_02920 [Thermoplasmata archaeon HGW-Thermoplasmata-2]
MFKKMNLTQRAISILIRLARSPEREYYVRELANAVGVSVGGTYNILEMLRESDLVKRKKAGRNTYYKIDPDHPAVSHFKIFANVMDLNETMASLKDNSRKIILFGSCSTGNDTMDSDIDLLIITEDSEMVRDVLKRAGTDRKIMPVILSPRELIVLKEKDPAFYNEASKGIVLWREKNE